MNSIFANYLLVPIFTVLSTIALAIMNKKQKVMDNKNLIILILLTGIVLGMPGLFGMMEQAYIPYGFLFSQFVYLFLGILFLFYLMRSHKDALENHRPFMFFASCVCMLAGVYVFKIIFDFFNPVAYNYLVASSIFPFIIPLLFYWAYVAILSIPAEVYKVWHYPVNPDPIDYDSIDFNNLMIIELEIYKKPDDNTPLKIKAKAPPHLTFGTWFQMFIEDYNLKFDTNGIRYLKPNDEPYGWLFYVTTGGFKKKVFIDPDLTIAANKITEQHTIVSKRVLEQPAEQIAETYNINKMASVV
ncbi:MAG: hypothetical protein JWQ40_4407 [Segetibacter sp.]|nr:hypothetical protein [Segetibacter sp.]